VRPFGSQRISWRVSAVCLDGQSIADNYRPADTIGVVCDFFPDVAGKLVTCQLENEAHGGR